MSHSVAWAGQASAKGAKAPKGQEPRRLSGEMTMTKKTITMLLTLGLVATIGACAKTPSQEEVPNQPVQQTAAPENNSDLDATEGANMLDANANLIKEVTGYDDDCCAGAAETLAELKVGELAQMELAPNRSYTYRAETVDGRVYYLGFGGLGYLELVRADDINGEVVWGVID